MRSKKYLSLLLVVLLISIFAVGCGSKAPAEEDKDQATEVEEETPEVEEEVDAVTSASIVDNNEDFLKSISKDGNWITAVLKDLTFDEELVLEGDGFESHGNPDRKIGLYSSDADNKITASYTLTAPKLTIKSSPARMLNGTFVGDIYVEADDFLLQGMKVEGNIYFTSESAQETFVNDGSEVTGVVELAE